MKPKPHSLKHHHLSRAQKIAFFATVNFILLVANVFSYFFVSQYSVYPILAEETLMCLKVCSAGSPTCDFGTCANPASVTTSNVSDVSTSSATGGGDATSDGGDTITARGVAIATHASPTTSDIAFSTSGTTGTFTVSITGLSAGTTYYARAYATNGIGTAYGGAVSFTTSGLSSGQTQQSSGGGGGGSYSFFYHWLPAYSPETMQSYIPYLVENKYNVRPYNTIRSIFLLDFGDFALDDSIEDDSMQTPQDSDNNGYIDIPYSAQNHLTFSGETNIKNAYIIITLSSPESIYATTRADENGRYSWTVPQLISLGDHELHITAVSPQSEALKENFLLLFELIDPSQQISPSPTPTPAPTAIVEPAPEQIEIIETPLPTQETPIKKSSVAKKIFRPLVAFLSPKDTSPPEVTPETYIVSTNILSSEEKLQPTNTFDIETEITSLNPSASNVVTLVFSVFDASGARLYLQEKQVEVRDTSTDVSKIVTSTFLVPGNYFLTAEVHSAGKTFIASHPFQIKPYQITIAPSLTFSAPDIQKGLKAALVSLTISFAVFLSLLSREFGLARKAHAVTERDLWKEGDIV